ncbi:FlgL Flagellin and related hook-associated proteins [Oxalobacteraceae bacterium]
MAVINTNVKALMSQSALKRTEGTMSKAMAQLSTGKRINSAADDAAGLAIATRMTHQIRSLNQAVRNAGDAISLIQTAEGATNEITDMMQRMRELAIQAVNDTNDNAQRSYLDLEFQQLKAEIVHISESTEWNGFPLLSGTAGERVGEMPVYKTTSVSQFGDVFISPTTTRTVSGDDGGEVQTLTFTAGTLAEGTITVAGIDIEIGSDDIASISAFAAKVIEGLEADSSFDPTTSGRTISQNLGVLTITYAASDGNIDDIEVDASVAGVTWDVDTPTAAIVSADESFSSSGTFLKSGALDFSVTDLGVVSASFITSDNQTITLTGVAVPADGTVTFDSATGNNSQVISEDLVYTFKDDDGNTESFTSRAVGLSIAVEGSIPALRAGDLRINGIDIGASYATDDPYSPVNNASGSAIAKAAAINRLAGNIGTTVGESQTLTFTGTPSAGTITVGGVSVTLTASENTSVLAAAKIASTLRASTSFNPASGRVITYAPGGTTINIDFPVSERNVAKTEVLPGTTGLSAIVDTAQEYSTMRPGTGVYAKVNENIFTGRSMTADSVVEGAVFINGYASADITTVLNNTRATRESVVNAINSIAAKTGVKAIDTGYDSKGITLVAADGRNIEVRFETDSNAELFGERIGLREGVHSGTYSLESKIPAPVVISSATTGDVTRTGLIEGNFTKNQSVFNTSARATVDAPVAQVSAVALSSAATAGDVYTVTINGTTFSHTAVTGALTAQDIRDAIVDEITGDSDYDNLGVTVAEGRTESELLITASTPGTPFTLSISSSSSASSTITKTSVKANSASQAKPLNVDDLVINGIKIRATTTADDLKSSSIASSSDPSASAIALAAAINSHSSETGVRALANPIISKGLSTITSAPTISSSSGATYNLYINGTTVPVVFVQDETGTERREKVVEAINARTGQHGVTATDNGSGVTLETDGRNFSVWFDSNEEDVSAASFGLDKGGAVAQVSRVTIGDPVAATDKATVVINGVTVTSAVAGGTNAALLATELETAINAKITSGDLKNISVEVVGDNLEITSTVAGSPFTLTGAAVTPVATATATLSLGTVTANSFGNNDVTGIVDASETSTSARTIYSTVRMISDPALLPGLPAPAGAPPSDLLDELKATGKAFSISVGDKGYGTDGNFAALGFQEGTFGGRSSEDMDPPKVGRLAFQVGSSANQYITIDLADFGKNGTITGDITGDVDLNVEDRRVRINTRDGASSVLNLLDDAMDKVNATRATMGAVMNRMEHVINNLSNVSTNLSASRSQIEDADYAQASTDLAKTQIMQQAATAVLAQANTSQQTVLKLLGG